MDLRERIIRTVSYFDLFDFPPTRAEVRRWMLGEAPAFGEVDAHIDALIVAGTCREADGVLYLAGGESFPAARESRFRHAARKWRRARRWARVFAALPGVELVGVGNTLAFHAPRDRSDIDLFIVTRPGAIWRTRFFAASVAALFRLRPRAEDVRDTLCLSFFATSDALNLSALALAPGPDVYLSYWTAQMVPLAGSAQAAAAFRAANRWTAVSERGVLSTPPAALRALFAPLALLPGRFMHGWQRRKFPADLRAALARGDGSVIVSDRILKFHVNDRRAALRERWLARVSSL